MALASLQAGGPTNQLWLFCVSNCTFLLSGFSALPYSTAYALSNSLSPASTSPCGRADMVPTTLQWSVLKMRPKWHETEVTATLPSHHVWMLPSPNCVCSLPHQLNFHLENGLNCFHSSLSYFCFLGVSPSPAWVCYVQARQR